MVVVEAGDMAVFCESTDSRAGSGQRREIKELEQCRCLLQRLSINRRSLTIL